MDIGYARVSTQEQDLTLQLDALKQAGCGRIFNDKASGKNAQREGLMEALSHLRDGDTLIVWKLDRLGRSIKSLIELVEELERKGIQFKSLSDNIDTSSSSGRFFFHVMAALAQMERELIGERTRAGLAAARRMGRTGGRPRKMTPEKLASAKRLIESGMFKKDVAKQLGVSRAVLYHWLARDE